MHDPDEVVFGDEGDDLVVFADDPQPAAPVSGAADPGWTVLVVDDEVAVHDVTRLALAELTFEGRPLHLVSAYSAAEAAQALDRHPDTAVILLDVVMETDRAGLDFVRQVRTGMGNQLVRIILRTGQPGHAPEQRVIVEYDINDYKQKADLTAQRLFTALIGALRSYRDLRYIADFNQALRRFVPVQLTQMLGKGSIVEVGLGDHVERVMGVAFCDLRSFTTMSEQQSPSATFRFLNRYLAAIGPVARAHNGYIDKYVGDAILAIFPDGADDALCAAIAMQRTVDAFNLDRAEHDEPPIAVGVGVHVGPLVLGIIGEVERLEGTVIADTVNVACRVEGLCKEHAARIVATRECVEACLDAKHYATRYLGALPVRGKADPVEAYEVLGLT
ncbi:MAG TPA: adenylate/guanylate cyclase domain-containing protein [Sporichthya sp.]|nr:adenylate/guanylate cyclase domain-containing protein [Sporichthya sp.]